MKSVGASSSKAPPLPKLCLSSPSLYLKSDSKGIMRPSAARAAAPAIAMLAHGLSAGAEPTSDKLGKRATKRAKPDTAGAGWANMRVKELTPELKRELQMIRMRGALDPKRFYRTSDMKKELPKYFQVGTVVEGTGEGKTRPAKGSLFKSLINDQKIRARAKNQFRKVQQATMAGVKKSSGPKPKRNQAKRR